MDALSAFSRPGGRGVLFGALAVFQLFFLRTLRSGRTIFALVLCALPLALCGAIGVLFELPGHAPRGKNLFEVLALTAYLQFLVPYVSLLFGSYAVSEDVEGKTVIFLFIRPVAKEGFVFGKWAIAFVLSTLVIVSSLTACFLLLSAKSEGEGLVQECATLSSFLFASTVGCCVYTAVFCALGALIKRALLVGLIVTSIWEVAVANIPAPIQGATVMYYVRVLLFHSGMRVKGVTDFMAASADLPSREKSLIILGSVAAVGLLLSLVAIRVREYVLER